MKCYIVQEVQNYGGFFGGDTVTLIAMEYGGNSAEQTLTIDQQALTNVPERHQIVAGMLLGLTMAGERVEQAELLGAATHAELRAALGIPVLSGPLAGPQILSYYCEQCGLWVAGAPDEGQCRVCG